MSNPQWNKQTTNTRDASTKKIGHYGREEATITHEVHLPLLKMLEQQLIKEMHQQELIKN